MGKIAKLIARLLSRPKDFTWEELVRILAHYGYLEQKAGKTGGSRRKFTDQNNNIISLHKPLPGNLVKNYQLNEIIDHLKTKSKILDE